MFIKNALRISDTETFWSRLDPRSRIYFLLAFVSTVLFVDIKQPICFGMALFILLLFFILSGSKAGPVFKRIIVILPMILLSTFLLPFQSAVAAPGTEKASLLIFNVLPLYASGIQKFLQFTIKSLLILSATVIFISATPVKSILHGLAKMKVPEWLLSVLTFLLKLLHLFNEELQRMHMGFASRHIRMSYLQKIRTLAKLSAVYFVRVFERGDRTYLAMMSRGFTGNFPANNMLHWKRADNYFVGLTTLFLMMAVLWK